MGSPSLVFTNVFTSFFWGLFNESRNGVKVFVTCSNVRLVTCMSEICPEFDVFVLVTGSFRAQREHSTCTENVWCFTTTRVLLQFFWVCNGRFQMVRHNVKYCNEQSKERAEVFLFSDPKCFPFFTFVSTCTTEWLTVGQRLLVPFSEIPRFKFLSALPIFQLPQAWWKQKVLV